MAEEVGIAICGKWKSTTVENFDEYLEALDVNLLARTFAAFATTYLDISKDGDAWCIKYKVVMKSGQSTFKLNEEFDEETPDGRKVKSTVYIEDGWLKHLQKGTPFSRKIEKKVQEDGTMIEIATVVEKNVSSKRIYVRDV